MPTKIGPNKTNLYGAIISPFFLCGFFVFLSYKMAPTLMLNFRKHGFEGIMLLPVIMLLSGIILIIWFIRKFYALPFWAIIDDDLKTLELKYLLQKSKLIRRDHMVAYEDATFETHGRGGGWEFSGFSLQLVDGTKILVSLRSLDDVFYVKSMFDYWGVKKLEGEEHYDV